MTISTGERYAAIRGGIADARSGLGPRGRSLYRSARLRSLYFRAWGRTEHGLSHVMLRLEWAASRA